MTPGISSKKLFPQKQYCKLHCDTALIREVSTRTRFKRNRICKTPQFRGPFVMVIVDLEN